MAGGTALGKEKGDSENTALIDVRDSNPVPQEPEGLQ
jgi:hypothetical protein